MKNRKRRFKWFTLIGLIILLYQSPLSLATGGNVLRTQGLINSEGNLKAGYLLINEMRVYIDKMTKVMDHREVPISITELKPKKWIYMEIEKDPSQKIIKARKIYLLPYYVNQKERQRFSFMK